MAEIQHGATVQVVQLPDGRWLIIHDELSASDVITYNFTGAAAGGETKTITTDLDALLQKTLTQTFSVDSLLQKTILVTLSADALLLKKEFTSTSILDALLRKAQVSQSVIDAILIGLTQGEVCWGYDTAVEEANIRNFAANWTGTGAITGSADDEIITLDYTESMESEVVNIGANTVKITLDKYGAGSGPAATVEYKDGDSEANCEADTWNSYTVPFVSTGYVKIKVAAP